MPSASFTTVVEMFLHRVRSTPESDAFQFRRNGGWQTMSWREAGQRARAIATGLRSLGLAAEDRCAILSGTRVEWILADMGILAAGCATTTIYPSNTAEECTWILVDSDSRVVFAEDTRQVEKLRASSIPELRHVVVFDGQPSADGWVLTLAQLEERGAAWDREHPGAFDAGAAAVRADQLATLIYTSGTTGRPKGVMLTHACWAYEGEAVSQLGLITPHDKHFLFLPLAHSFAKVLEVACIRIGVPTAIDGDIDALVENLQATQPTFLGAVPRVFEKVHNKVVNSARESGGAKYKLFRWAFEVGKQVSRLRQAHKEPPTWLALEASIADRLVFSKIKALFGGRVRFLISGGAPLPTQIAEFFHAADLLVLEGYGLTESSAGTFLNLEDRYRFGTVGPALPGTEVRIADDGEILVRGPGVMRGYHRMPEATAEALDGEGWLHTGDVGRVEDGFLVITDRKKDLIKTSGGKYVAPQPIENRLKALCPLVSQVVVHGDNRKFCTALVTLNREAAAEWVRRAGRSGSSYAELARDEGLRAEIGKAVEEVNRELASYEAIRRFSILPAELSQDEGELTPTQKVKRRKVEEKYRGVLDGLYEGA